MLFLSRLIRRLLIKGYLLKASIGYRIFGIDFVAQEISKVPLYLVPLLLKKYGANIGKNVNFKDNIQIDNANGDFSNLIIGNKCYIGKGVFFDLPNKIILEDEVVISAGVKILSHADCGNRIMSKWYPRKCEEVVIGCGSWIGVNAIIFPGVKLGKCCVVAAGSVVRKSFPDYSVVAGIPAKLVKKLRV